MQKSPLFKLIDTVRQNLAGTPQFGKLISEKFLLLDGELTGQQFCFENADVNWRFDSQSAEIVTENRVQTMPVINLTGHGFQDSHAQRKAA